MAEGKLSDIQTIDNILNEKTLDGNVLVVRQYHIADFKELIQEIDTKAEYKTWQNLVVYADQIDLTMPDSGFGVDLSSRQSVTIVARLMTVNTTAKALYFVNHYPDTNTAVVNLRIQGYVSDKPLLLVSGYDNPKAIALPKKNNGGLPGIDCQTPLDNELQAQPFLTDGKVPSAWSIGSPFYWLLLQTFQDGFTTMNGDADTALKMFRWVQQNTLGLSWEGDASLEMQALGSQAASMALRLARAANVSYVPKLDLHEYQSVVAANAAGATSLETYYNQFMGQIGQLKASQGTAELMIKDVETQIKQTDSLIQDNLDRLKSAQGVMQKNLDLFNRQQMKVPPGPMEEAKKAFQEALDKKKEEAETQAFFKVMGAVADLGSALAGNPAAPAEAVGEVSKIAELIEMINKIIETLEKINKIIELADSIYEMVQAFESGKDIPGADVAMPDSTAAQTLSATDWAVLRERWDAAFPDNVLSDDTLGGAAKQYRAAGRILIIYGQAVTDARVTVANLQGEIGQLSMKKKLYQAQKSQIQAYIEASEYKEGQYGQVALLLRQRYLDVKRRLMMEILDFEDAYRYWALAYPRSTQGLNLNAGIAEMAEVTGGMVEDINAAFNHFSSQAPPVLCHISYTLTDDEKAQLSQGNAVQVTVRPEDAAFNGWDRVRIEYVQVLIAGLEDAAANLEGGGKVYHCQIRDSGEYMDRLDGVQYGFVAQDTLERPFASHVHPLNQAERSSDNSVVNVPLQDSSDLSQTTSNPFYRPAAFTTWSISLPSGQGDNDKIDYTPATSLKLRLYGSAMQA